MSDWSRRAFLSSSSILVLPLTISGQAASGPAPSGLAPSAAPPALFPLQEPSVVKEVVGAAHRDLARVKELVDARPALACATWDWGFGDWESALGAASHVGRPDIAEYLISKGARPDMFTAAMLGNLELVRALITASPGVQRVKGPHSITLMRHAQAGGDRAKPVVDYLLSVGGADERPATAPISNEDRDRLVGTYAYGSGADERLEVLLQREQLAIRRVGGDQKNLFHVGDLAFYPSGADAVRITFARSGARVTVHVADGPVNLSAAMI